MTQTSETDSKPVTGTKPRYAGEVECWDVTPFLKAAEILIHSDEPERALHLLNNIPARYRDAPPPDVRRLKEEILGAMVTAHAYMTNDMDATVSVENSLHTFEALHRAKRIKEVVMKLNADGHIPHIVDMGPGEYWLPIGLEHLGARFSYHDIGMLGRTARQARELISAHLFADKPASNGKQKTIFCALEIIEHLPSPQDIAIEAARYCGGTPDYVFLSTPLYTYDGKDKNWNRDCGLPHLRAYTPNEFILEANKLFPGFTFSMSADEILLIEGVNN